MEPTTGMAGFMQAITGTDGITSANMWGQLTPAGATIGAIAVFAFGYYVVRKVIKGASRGKARI